MLKTLRFALLLLFPAALWAAIPFPQEQSDLHPDPAARFGTLPNGLRYVVMPNKEPRDRASLRLLVLTGSLEERDDQRGLAHFLEHMAFNGSTHYPPGTLVEYFQRLGMSFGGDTNAYTSFDHTAYKIELPNTQPATVAEGLKVFADMAGGLLLRPDMITKERPIILSEKRTRDSVDYRQFVASFEFLLADSRFPQRLPIGLQSVIETATRDRFVDLYDTWYRPERMVVLVIGQIDPAAVARQIAEAFGPIADRAPVRPDPDLGHVATALGLQVAYHSEPEAPSTTVSIDVTTPYSYIQDTASLRLKHLPRDLAVAMINRRLEILSKKDGAPFIRANADIEESYNFLHDAGLNLTCTPAQWPAALAAGEQQLRGALQFGFTPAELAEAVANFRNDLTQAAATAATRHSDELADEFVDSLVLKNVFTSPADDLALLGPALEQVTPDDCANALRTAFGAPGRYVMVSGNAQIPGDAKAAIIQAYEAAHAVAVQPPAKPAEGGFAYKQFGPPGEVTSRQDIEDLDLTEVTFANGVRLNLKKTNFEQNQIRVRLRVGAGLLAGRPDQPALPLFTDLTFAAGGLGRHSADDLQRILAGKTVGLEFGTGNDAFEFSAATNNQDLLLQLQLLTAYLTDPGYRPEALRVARKNIDEFYNELAHSIEGPVRAEIPRLLANGDTRFGLPSREVALASTLDQEKAWLQPQLSQGPIELALVGDLDPDAVVDDVARTLGALPPRLPKPAYTAERRVSFPSEVFSQDLSVPTEIPKALVALYWPTADARDVHLTRRLGLLGDVFSDRLRVKIREQLGGAYSPEAGNESSDTFTDYGKMVATCVVAPDRAAEIEKSILAIAADLHANGVTPDELDRAKKPILTSLRQSVRTNQYWIAAVVGSCQEFPQRLDWARTRQTDIEAITKADLDALAKQYLGADHAFQVIVRPAAAPAKP